MVTKSITPNQERALAALLTCPSVAAAARQCGLSDKTVWKYLSDADFKSELQRRRGDLVGATTTGLVASSQLATETLHSLLSDDATPSAVKARVAQAVVELARKSVELDDVLERLERLEAINDGKNAG